MVTTYPQAVALKALGYPQDVWPQLVLEAYSETAWSLAGDDYYTWAKKPLDPYPAIRYIPWYAAPNVIDAVLWVLGSEAWLSRFGYLGLNITPEKCWLWFRPKQTKLIDETAHLDADTPSLLLDAMLAEITVETSTASATPTQAGNETETKEATDGC